MPLSRYEIRNEYSLADPELYRAADKDDPEALLEGVAMAGLVGVLRQLGDLAEFAAEIFHDLHEDLMATAARGHSLTVRVQQIETEFPSIEKAFLSHTSHSSFFYNTGVDWHPTVHMDQNLVTQGDLPRFVMDSYEECRGPPRLFLLDKFDVAGAGSCLKRYTDPSFFKTESPLSVMSSAEVQREKKGRKSKKKGSRWKNAETPEVLSTPHVKLQQLLLEERVENHVSDPARRVKLKKRLNGSPFDSTLGKSYMDAILKIPTPESDTVREISITSSPLKIITSVAVETENKVLDIAAISPGKDTKHRKRNTYSSSDSEAAYKPSNHSVTEYSGISPNLTSTQIDHVHSTPNEVDKKEIAPERVGKIDGNQSDDEVDNYVDALTSMDSEMETDTEYRAKNDMRPLNVNGRRMGSDVTEELSEIQTHSTDSRSVVNSSLMDGGNSISRRGKSSFTYSGSPDLAENSPSEEVSSAKTIQSTAQHEPSSCSSIIESNSMVQPADPGEHFTKRSLLRPELDVISSNHSNLKGVNVNNGESSFHLFKNIPWTSNYNTRPSQTDDADSSKMSPKSMDEENEQDTHESYASLHLPNDLLDSDCKSNEVSRNDIIQGELLENEQILDSVGSPVQSLPTFFTQKEEFANSEIETCCPLMEPEENASEETTSRCSSILDCSVTADHVDMPLRKPENDHLLDPGVGFSHYQEIKPDGASSSKGDGEELSGSSFDNDFVQDNGYTYSTSEIRSCQDSQHAVDVSLDDEIKGITYLQDKDVRTTVSETSIDDNGGDAASLDTRSMTLQAKPSLVLPDMQQNDLKSDEHIHKSSLVETVNKQANVFSELEPISSETQACDDYSDLDLSRHVSDSFSAESSRDSSHLYEKNTVECSYHKVEDAEAKSLHNVNVIEREQYAHSSPTCHLAGIRTAQDLQVELYKDQYDVESSHDLITELKSTHHAVVIVDTERVLSSPKNHLADVGTFDQVAESQNGTLDDKSCHVTHDQVPELEYSHQTCAINVEEKISSSTHDVTELTIPLEEKIEPQKDQFEFESRYAQISPSTSPEHIVSVGDLISSPTHIKAELKDSRELEDETLTNTYAVEPCQQQHSDSCEKAEASVAPFTYDTTELNPPVEHEVEFQNNQFEVKSWQYEGFELEHQIIATKSSETVVYSDTKVIAELTTPIDHTYELQDQFNQESRRPSNTNVDPLSLFRLSDSSIPNIQERESCASEISAVHLPNQPSVSQNLPQFSVSKPAEDPLISKLPTVDLLPEASLEEMPPLPPLPPMQWMLGKAPHNFPDSEENLSEHSMHTVPPLIVTTKDISLLVHPTSGAESNYPSSFSLEIHNSQSMDVDQADYVVHSSYTSSRPDPDLVTIAPSGLEPQMDHSGKSEIVLSDSSRGILRQGANPFSSPATVENTSSALLLSGKTVESLDQPTPSTSCKLDNNIQGEAIVSEERTLNLPTTASSLPVIHVYEKQPVLSTSEQHATWISSSSLSLASSEDGTPNRNEKIKLPRPRNPLIDAVVAHDKSKLRKVTQLPQAPLGQKGEERDSLLEQIRAKSFNLKPAVVTRPSIQGPQTNLRLAAILEKANAIRQAFAGNGSDDDDDEDRWSDS